MNCLEIESELSAYIDGELSPGVRAAIDKHVSTCPHCQKRVAELKKLAAGVAALPQPQPAPEFLNEVRKKIARGEEPSVVSWQDMLFRSPWFRVSLGAAAVVAVFVLLTNLLRPVWQRQSELTMAKVQEAPARRDERTPSEEKAAPAAPPARGAASTLEQEKNAVAQAPEPVGTTAEGAPSNGRLVVSNNVTVLYLNERPAETIITEADDPAEVETQVGTLVASLRGAIIGQDNTRSDVQKFYVSLPAENIQAFKTQFTTADMLSKQRRDQARGQALKLFSAAAKAKAPLQTKTQTLVIFQDKDRAGALGVRGKTESKPTETPGTAVVEIQVVPPKN
jgi:anti-sigma factor RsiW